jgi:hypothetical protein
MPKSIAAKKSPLSFVERDRKNVSYLFIEMCKFCARYSKSTKAINANSVDGQIAMHYLKRLAFRLPKVIPSFPEADFQVIHCKGRPSLPRVPWVSINPHGQFVASSLSVTICFGRNGDGAVVGLMNAASTPMHTFDTVIRTKGDSPIVDVNGAKQGTRYNNLFLNPKEFLLDEFSAEELGIHLAASLDLLKQHAAIL